VLTPSPGDDVDFCVAILVCHLNGKGNQLSQHLFPRKKRRLRVVAKPVQTVGKLYAITVENLLFGEPKPFRSRSFGACLAWSLSGTGRAM
jgi:hypothetical protein